MKVQEDIKNGLLKRRELKLIITSEKNPAIKESRKKIAEEFKSPEENIIIDSIKGKFGRNTFLIKVKIYDSKEDKEKIEPKPKEKKGAEKQQETTPAEGGK